MSFLTIPTQEGLFTTIESGKSGKEAQSMSSPYDEVDEEEDDDEPRFIPRCSPVPRKRGASIHDETAEYMRIHLALSAGKRVSFADTTGGDLVDVKEFVAFDSDEEEGGERREDEGPTSRRPEREPVYAVRPEFVAPGRGDLLRAVRNNKVEVERVCQVEDEPLSFTGLIRVLNISFQKAVYIRSTMDSWLTYYDHPAEYVQGSHDGDTDQFSFKLSFAPPYVTHGSRIEFVVRYETADGDFWANNSSLNYVVTLLLVYEDDDDDDDDAVRADADVQQIRSILKPPKPYSTNDDFDSEDEQEREEEGAGTSMTGLIRPTAVCPVIVQPEIDIEIADNPSGDSIKPNQDPPSADGTLSAQTGPPGERFPSTSSETTLQTSPSPVQPIESPPLPTLHCELGNRASARHVNSSSSAPLSSPQQESRPGSDGSQAEGEEVSPSEAPLTHPSTTETNQMPPTGEDESIQCPASGPPLELAAECVCAPGAAEAFVQEVDAGLSELVAGLSEGSGGPCDDSAPSLPPPTPSPQASAGAEGEAPSPPELPERGSTSTGANEARADAAPRSASASQEKEDAPRIPPDTLLENLSSTLSEASERRPEPDESWNLMPSIVALCGVVSLSIVMQEPNTLFFIGLLLLLHHL